MILTKEEAREMVWDDHDDFECIEDKVIDSTRWSIINEGIFKHLPSGKFYRVSWSSGATEMQDESPFEYEDEVELEEVELKEILTLTWVSKNQE